MIPNPLNETYMNTNTERATTFYSRVELSGTLSANHGAGFVAKERSGTINFT
jgi:hypothetical protein